MSNTPEDSARDLLSRMRIGGIWEPEGLGLTYMRTGETEIELVTQDNTAFSAQARIRMKVLIQDIDWTVKEEDTQIIEPKSEDPFTRHMENTVRRQEMAQNNWRCPNQDCGCLMSAFVLEEGEWIFHGQSEYESPNGDLEEVEQWAVSLTCPVCGTVTEMEPYDFGLLAGDEIMLSYQSSVAKFTALERPEIIEMMDSDSSNFVITGTFCPFSGEILPPHVRGAVVKFEPVKEDEGNVEEE